MLANFGGLGLGIISAALQARLLGPEGRGLIATAVVPATIFMALLTVGLPDFYARKAAQSEPRKSMASESLIFSLLIGGLVFVPVLAYANFVASDLPVVFLLLFLYGAFSPVFIYGFIAVAVASGFGDWRIVAIVKLLPGIVTVFGLIILYISGATVLTVGLVIFTSAVIGAVTGICAVSFFGVQKVSLSSMKEAVSFSMRSGSTGTIAFLNQRIDILILTVVATKIELGYYAVAITLASLPASVGIAFALPIRNRVSQGEHRGVAAASAMGLLATTVLSTLIIVTLPFLVPFVLGADYLPSIPIMAVLLCAQLPLCCIVILTGALVGVGRPGSLILGEVATFLVAFAGISLLVPHYGAIAAAIATLVSKVPSLAWAVAMCRRYVSDDAVWKYFIPTRESARLVKVKP
ncbi:hypothetical protein BJI47_14680 [Rhodococcus sp. 1168]|nr:hypothetical protein BJI47_14680 [Rhodococcus sp. 1168]